MELHYDITKQDFIDFNLNYYNNNAIVQRSIRTMRIATAAIVILGGSALMYWLHTLTPVSIAVYVALAAVCFWGTPRYMRHKMIKNIEKSSRTQRINSFADRKRSRCVKANSSCPDENERYRLPSIRPFSAPQPQLTSIIHIFGLMNSPRSSCRSQRLKTMRRSRSSTTKSPQISRMKL